MSGLLSAELFPPAVIIASGLCAYLGLLWHRNQIANLSTAYAIESQPLKLDREAGISSARSRLTGRI